ncbi:hypothetical protein ACN20G_03105 [Streptomyces sp. BI20]|uniref:hypothetical protein n=1 Tax=Streptomyces sp. BI20 TaxID=3403460 RepID=UPI003C72E99D
MAPPLDPANPPVPLLRRTWEESWVTVRCGACGRDGQWPHPELGCAGCGTLALVPVLPVDGGDGGDGADRNESGAGGRTAREELVAPGHGRHRAPEDTSPAGGAVDPVPSRGPGSGSHRGPRAPERVPEQGGPREPGPREPGARASAAEDPGGQGAGPAGRGPFRPVTIRTTRDAVSSAVLYLRWLGFRDVRQPDPRPAPAPAGDEATRPAAAVDLRAPGVIAQVDPTTAPVGPAAVECVWLNGLTVAAAGVYFALAGYTDEARARADALGIPLFTMDLTGVPQGVNDAAEQLVGAGAP